MDDKTITLTKPEFLIIVFGLLASFGLALHQYLLFLKAFFSPQKAVVLYINYYGEANGEMVILTVSILIGALATGYILWGIRNGKQIGLRK
jgi:hypothetical protein